MGDILSAEDYNTIRAMLGGVGEELLSDETIESFPFLPRVEVEIKAKFPTWETIHDIGGGDWILLKTGTACLTAYVLATNMFLAGAGQGGFSVGGYSESATGFFIGDNGDRVQAGLLRCVSSSFSELSRLGATRPSSMIVSGPTSTGYNVPESYEAWIKKVLPSIVVWEMDEGQDAT